ncbi:MAG: winged helix-turn-helix domain-containing protein, partial [Streptosporangiaceae bacterium]
YDYFGGTRTVDVHVRRLRAKLGAENEDLIGTVRNVGYRFVPARPGGRPADTGDAAAPDAADPEPRQADPGSDYPASEAGAPPPGEPRPADRTEPRQQTLPGPRSGPRAAPRGHPDDGGLRQPESAHAER